MMRSHRCGDLRAGDAGTEVTLCGWVDTRRDHGGVTFVDLRDTAGFVQVVFSSAHPEAHAAAQELRNEYCIKVTGTVERRSDATINDRIPTGEVEVVASSVEILSRAETPPFQIDEHQEVNEDLRLKYRYLDVQEVIAELLARPAMQHVVITGRAAPPELLEAAHTVTDMGLVKHAFSQGIRAQPGIEL